MSDQDNFLGDMTVRDFIVGLRGGIPPKCDFCDAETPPEQMEPEEGGDWVCWKCLDRWEKQEAEETR